MSPGPPPSGGGRCLPPCCTSRWMRPNSSACCRTCSRASEPRQPLTERGCFARFVRVLRAPARFGWRLSRPMEEWLPEPPHKAVRLVREETSCRIHRGCRRGLFCCLCLAIHRWAHIWGSAPAISSTWAPCSGSSRGRRCRTTAGPRAEPLLAVARSEPGAPFPDALPDPKTLCDHGHPTIRQLAQSLECTTPADTAEAIFRYVQSMPFRFGLWQELASDTLARGSGLCTTKAN